MESSPAVNPYEAPKTRTERRQLPRLVLRAAVARWLLLLHVPAVLIGSFVVTARRMGWTSGNGHTAFIVVGLLAIPAALVLRLAEIAAFCLWIHAAYVRATSVVTRARFTPAASVGWWFAPVANFWMPFEVVSHLWRLSRSGDEWQRFRSPSYLGIWWGCWCASSLLGAAAFVVRFVEGSSPWIVIENWVAPALSIIATLLAMRLIRDITAMQHDRLGVD
jgi:hypothetical protein